MNNFCNTNSNFNPLNNNFCNTNSNFNLLDNNGFQSNFNPLNNNNLQSNFNPLNNNNLQSNFCNTNSNFTWNNLFNTKKSEYFNSCNDENYLSEELSDEDSWDYDVDVYEDSDGYMRDKKTNRKVVTIKRSDNSLTHCLYPLDNIPGETKRNNKTVKKWKK